jgi:hypothetical protein
LNQALPWRLVDKMIAGYGIFVAIVATTRFEYRGAWWVFGAHLALPLLAWLVTRANRDGIGGLLRAMYPVLLLAGLYSSIDILNGFGAAKIYDAPIQSLEAMLFGGQPSREWWRSSPSEFWSRLMHAVYFSYYIMIPLPVVVFLATRRRESVEGYLDGLIATFLVCYLAYMLVPVAGPYYEYARPVGEFVDNGPARLVYATLSKGSSYGAAFPSSHVAATVAATLGAWLVMPRLGRLMAIPTALLTVGVVYTQMHYVVDSLAGVIVGLVVPLTVARMTSRR